jgi:hypothetical protein
MTNKYSGRPDLLFQLCYPPCSTPDFILPASHVKIFSIQADIKKLDMPHCGTILEAKPKISSDNCRSATSLLSVGVCKLAVCCQFGVPFFKNNFDPANG